jgi:arginine transport system permease protein
MDNLILLAKAASTTISLAVLSLVIGIILAIILTCWESLCWKPIAYIGTTIVILIRGVPEILVVLFVYFGISQLFLTLSNGLNLSLGSFDIYIKMSRLSASPFICGVISLATLYSAYASQTLRGSLKAIPVGQWESGQALGIGKLSIFLHLVMPQVWRRALPGLGNQWLVLLKDTALVSLISVNDLMLQTKSIATRTNNPFSWYLTTAIIYLLITLLSQILAYSIKRNLLAVKINYD